MPQQSLPNISLTTGQISALLDMTPKRVQELARAGVLEKSGRGQYRLESITAYITYLRGTAGATGGTNTKIEPSADLEAMIEAVKAAADYNDARTLKTKIDALRSAHALSMDQGRSMPVEEVREQLARATAIIRGGILAMNGELPPHLEGLTAPEIERQLTAYGHKMLTDWHETFRMPEEKAAPQDGSDE